MSNCSTVTVIVGGAFETWNILRYGVVEALNIAIDFIAAPTRVEVKDLATEKLVHRPSASKSSPYASISNRAIVQDHDDCCVSLFVTDRFPSPNQSSRGSPSGRALTLVFRCRNDPSLHQDRTLGRASETRHCAGLVSKTKRRHLVGAAQD